MFGEREEGEKAVITSRPGYSDKISTKLERKEWSKHGRPPRRKRKANNAQRRFVRFAKPAAFCNACELPFASCAELEAHQAEKHGVRFTTWVK
jgi:hypothetical protein